MIWSVDTAEANAEASSHVHAAWYFIVEHLY